MARIHWLCDLEHEEDVGFLSLSFLICKMDVMLVPFSQGIRLERNNLGLGLAHRACQGRRKCAWLLGCHLIEPSGRSSEVRSLSNLVTNLPYNMGRGVTLYASGPQERPRVSLSSIYRVSS